MVHGLEVLKRMNERAAQRPRPEAKKAAVPEEISLNPALVKRYLNRPWTDAELNGRPNLVRQYAESAAEPFRKADVKAEGPRP